MPKTTSALFSTHGKRAIRHNDSPPWRSTPPKSPNLLPSLTALLHGGIPGTILGSLPRSRMSAPSFWNYSREISRSENCFVNFINRPGTLRNHVLVCSPLSRPVPPTCTRCISESFERYVLAPSVSLYTRRWFLQIFVEKQGQLDPDWLTKLEPDR